MHIRTLLDAYPQALFILIVQQPAVWVAELNEIPSLRRRYLNADLPGLPWGVGGNDVKLATWYAAHCDATVRIFDYLGVRPRLLKLRVDHATITPLQQLARFLSAPVLWDSRFQ